MKKRLQIRTNVVVSATHIRAGGNSTAENQPLRGNSYGWK